MTFKQGHAGGSMLSEKVARVRNSPLFDAGWYREAYPDVAYLDMDPAEHFVRFGARMRRRPSPENNNDSYSALLATILSGAGASSAPNDAITESSIKRRLDKWDDQVERMFVDSVATLYDQSRCYLDRIPVSIVMPSYNRSDTICKAVDSVLAQTFQNWELLIVDDGSVDDTLSTLARYSADKRIRVFPLAHSGVSAARNFGLDNATGDYVFYLDTDNNWKPDLLKYMVAFMAIGRLDVAYCGLQLVNDENRTFAYRGDNFNWNACLKQNYIDMNCLAHRRFGSIHHRFDNSLERLVDWDYILRITLNARISFAPFRGVSYYDGSKGARITSTRFQGDKIKTIEQAVRRKHDDSVWDASHSVTWVSTLSEGNRRRASDDPANPIAEKIHALVDWNDLKAKSYRSRLVSIVVLNFQRPKITIQCIESILQHSPTYKYDFEVIVVDNGSDDGSFRMISDRFAGYGNVKCFAQEQNLMFSGGNNFGISKASGEYIVALNNDTLVTEAWFNPLIDALRLDSTVGFVGPQLLYEDGSLQCGGLVFSSRSKIPYHIYKGHLATAPQVTKSRFFQSLTGACLAGRSCDWVELQGFDPVYINGCEDLDLCFRMRERFGKRSLYEPRSVIYHLESKSPGRGKYIMRNREEFVQRWGAAVIPDDGIYYKTDGFSANDYVKKGSEQHGPTANYEPILVPAAAPPRRSEEINIGFSTIWHARGISFHTLQLAHSLESSGVRTHIFARWESDRFANEGPVAHPRVHNGGDDPSPREIADWVEQNGIDVMVFMEIHPKDWKRVYELKKRGVTVVCYENLDVLRTDNLHQYEVFDFFLFNCFHSRDVLSRRFPQKPSIMIPWGCPPAGAPFAEEPRSDQLHFVHVAGWGGVNNRKNTDILVRAFASSGVTDATLHLYTQSPILKYGADVAEICRRAANIKVYEGTIPDIAEAYRNKSMLLWPSKREGVGLPIIEALMANVPVLISDGYMMKEWIVPDEHGVVVEALPKYGSRCLPELEVDEQKLASAIAAIAKDPQRITRMRTRILEDKERWMWDWQSTAFTDEICSIARDPAYRPPANLSYIPPAVMEFEARRRHAFAKRASA